MKHTSGIHAAMSWFCIATLVGCNSQKKPSQEPPRPETPRPPVTSPFDHPVEKRPVVGPTPPVRVTEKKRDATNPEACLDAVYRDRYTPGSVPCPRAANQAAKTLQGLSLEEKADLIRGMPKFLPKQMSWKDLLRKPVNWTDVFRTPDNPKKKIRGFLFRDGPRGVNLDAQCPEGHHCYSTAFPVSIARGASFDIDLEYRIGRAVADETVAAGHTVILAPTINIVRHPAWGRTQESYGEDSYLLGKMGTAFVVGAQEYIPACSKHFIANNIELKRQESNAVMDEQTLREIYGTAYEMTIRDGGVACIMTSYNAVNGTPVLEHRRLLTEILREDYGFEGFVISDWWAMANHSKVDLPQSTYEAAAKKSLEAGVDLEMPWSLNYEFLERMVEKGTVDAKLIDRSARRILTQKYRFDIADLDGDIGLKRPRTRLDEKGSIEDNDAHLELAHEAALKSMVLLKNEKKTLPIDTTSVKSIAVLGANVPYKQAKFADKPNGFFNFAVDAALGDLGSSRVNVDPEKSVGPLEGIRRAAGEGIRIITGQRAEDAAAADFIVVVAGLTPGDEGEEYTGAGDRTRFSLDAKIDGTPQTDLIEAAIALEKPMAVVLVGGSIIEMPWLDQVPAVVMSWYAGIHGGRALGELLLGKASFSGKLPLSWPKRFEDLPTFDPGVPHPVEMGYELGYRYFLKQRATAESSRPTVAPHFLFGHGLSYTTFGYSNLGISCSSVTRHGVVKVKADVRNSGKRAGEEVVFLFVRYPESATERRPERILKGFARVHLEPGETKQVTLPLRIRDLKLWKSAERRWEVPTGKYQLGVGGRATRLDLLGDLDVR